MPENKIICGDWIEVAETLPSGIAHLIITSPAYWGQRLYSWGGDGSCEEKKEPHVWQIDEPIQICQNCETKAPTLGLEKTPEEHIEKLVLGFRELRRVLRDDGVVFLNYGDKYNNTSGGYYPCGSFDRPSRGAQRRGRQPLPTKNLKQGDLIGLAWRLALALQADGWYLRSDIIWAKALSFCEKYSGSTMPESVNGWRWERHRIKVGSKKGCKQTTNPASYDQQSGGTETPIWRDCPGCAKCAPDGLILRKGSWRPTRAHEYLFQLTKTSSYYCDMEAVREECSDNSHEKGSKLAPPIDSAGIGHKDWHKYTPDNPSGRNLRDVFCINPQAYPDSHYATFPEKLVEPCIKVGTSQKGCCPKCGAQWARIVDSKQVKRERPADRTDRHNQGDGVNSCGNTVAGVNTTTLGWLPTCKCGIKETVPCIVYDPFMGSGTVAAVAAKLGRNYLGSELNEDYIKNQAEYRVAEGETGISKQEQRQGQIPLFK